MINFIKGLVAAILLAHIGKVSAIELIIDIPMIAGKTKDEVVKLPGNTSGCTEKMKSDSCIFLDGKVEIFFVKGLADWITVGELDKYDHSLESVKYVGLKVTNEMPAAIRDIYTIWEPYDVYRSLILGKRKDGQLSYISVKVKTLSYLEYLD